MYSDHYRTTFSPKGQASPGRFAVTVLLVLLLAMLLSACGSEPAAIEVEIMTCDIGGSPGNRINTFYQDGTFAATIEAGRYIFIIGEPLSEFAFPSDLAGSGLFVETLYIDEKTCTAAP